MNGAVSAPRIISWNITLRCPLKCSHCYVDAGDKEIAGVLSTQEAFAVIDQIRATGRPVVVLSGGNLSSGRTYTISHGTARNRDSGFKTMAAISELNRILNPA